MYVFLLLGVNFHILAIIPKARQVESDIFNPIYKFPGLGGLFLGNIEILDQILSKTTKKVVFLKD